MAGERFIFFYKLQSFLNPAFSKITSAFFILYFSPASLWIQKASATQVSKVMPEAKTADWELSDDQKITFPRLRGKRHLGETNEGLIAASGLVDEAKQLYDAGKFLLSVQVWQQAAIAYRTLGDTPNQALALSSGALAYQQLGRLERAIVTSVESLKLLKKLEKSENAQIIAQILNNHASLQLASGQAEQALISWQKAQKAYQSVGDRAGVTWTLLNSTQALQVLGLYRRALDALDSAQQSLQSTPNSPLKAAALRSLGNTLRGVGDLQRSYKVLQQSLALARQIGLRDEIAATLISLGNTARLQQDKTAAWEFYKQAASSSGFNTTQAKLNQLSLLIEYKAIDAASDLARQLKAEISSLPAKRSSIYATINFAQSLKSLQKLTNNIPSQIEIAQLLANTVEQAKSIEDPRAEAYALGCLGNVYEQNMQWKDAKKLTQQALMLAQSLRSPDIDYRFSWQLGRILKAQGDIPGAISSLTQSTNALKSLRGDLASVNLSVQFDFRDQVEPVYRQLADLLLLSKQPSQENLIQARNAIEALQVAELNNFFQTACLDSKPTQIDTAIDTDDPKAAVIYPIILPDRLEVIVKLPGLPLQSYKVNIAQSKLEKLLWELRKNLSLPYTLQEVHLLSEQIYNWLIKPAQKSLATSGVETLVFVLDGGLRNIPMAALYDGQQYLIEKYAIALSPGLQMLPPEPIEQVKLKALSAGLTLARQGFDSLPGVGKELNQIKSAIPGVILLNQNFTTEALQNQLQEADFSIVHLATHGQFSSLAAKTYILAWDKPIFVKDLDVLLRATDSQHSAIELLVLSACETADGDNRAALGLAGVAVKAGARSTLATLWSVDDQTSSALMIKFYQELTQGKLNKAQALRQAQLAVLQSQNHQHPRNWSGYVLLGNWL